MIDDPYAAREAEKYEQPIASREAILALLERCEGPQTAEELGARLGLFNGPAPRSLGVRDGRLKPPSKTPNSVSSQAALHPDHPQARYAAIEPLPLHGDASASMAALDL